MSDVSLPIIASREYKDCLILFKAVHELKSNIDVFGTKLVLF